MKFSGFLLIVAVILISCSQKKKIIENDKTTTDESFNTENHTVVNGLLPGSVYHGSDTVFFDLIHTKLHLSFNYQLKQVIGTAEITLKPYFYPSRILQLDARNFNINEISLIKTGNHIPLKLYL